MRLGFLSKLGIGLLLAGGIGCQGESSRQTEAQSLATSRAALRYGTLAQMLAAGPLPQPVQNYLVEAALWGQFVNRAEGNYVEYRPSDGLQSRGLSRFVRDASNPYLDFCLIGTDANLLSQVEAALTEAVPTLTDDAASARFLPAGCYSDADITDFGRCSLDCAVVDRHPDTVFVFVDDPTQSGGACGVPQAGLCHQSYGGRATGDALKGGMLWATTPRVPAPTFNGNTLLHELGHVFGLGHTWGDPDVMSYRSRTDNYADHERQAFAVINQLPTKVTLSDMIELGVIQDTASVLREPPLINFTQVSDSLVAGRTTADPSTSVQNRAFAGEKIILWGERLSLPLSSESNYMDPNPPNFSRVPFGYRPPIVHFGSLEVVANLDANYQLAAPRDAGTEIWTIWNSGAAPVGRLTVAVPAGAGSSLTTGSPLSLERYDGAVTSLASFSIETSVAPPPNSTPKPAVLSCSTESGGLNRLTWTLPSTYLDGTTAFNPANAKAQLFYNGQPLLQDGSPLELPATQGSFLDPTLRQPKLGSLYQIFLVNSSTGQVGVPSNVCRLAPVASGVETTLLMLDTTGSMDTMRADGKTRFEEMVGPLPAGDSGVPRAFATIDEIFGSGRTPRVAVWSFDSGRGVIDHVKLLTGNTFTSDRAVAENALLAIRAQGPDWNTPLADATCVSGQLLLNEFKETAATYATMRVFTDGEENFSIGVPECPSSCAGTGIPGSVPWNTDCRPGSCDQSSLSSRAPVDCTPCQMDVFKTYCPQSTDAATGVTFFVEYFGRGGPYSPLPADAGYFIDLAEATGGRYVHNADDGVKAVNHLPSDLAPTAGVGEPSTVECAGPTGTSVTLHGTAQDEHPMSELDFLWVGAFGSVHGISPTVTLPLGLNRIQLLVTDEHQTSDPAVTSINVIDTTAPTLTPASAVTVETCSLGQTEVALTPPTASDICNASPLVSGRVTSVSPPVPIVAGKVLLPPGTHTVEWTANDGHQTATATQSVVVRPAILASRQFLLRNGAALRSVSGGLAGLANAGSTLSQVENDTKLADVLSVAPVMVGDRVMVGAIRSSAAIHVGASTPGSLSPFAPVLLPAVPSLAGLIFPSSIGDRLFNASPTAILLAPGSYGQVSLNSGATVVLSAGTYYVQQLNFNANSKLVVPSSGTVRIYIASQLNFQGQVLQASGQLGELFIGYNGTSATVLAAPFRGTLIAPRAMVSMGTGNALDFRGRFFVRDIEARPNAKLICDPNVSAR